MASDSEKKAAVEKVLAARRAVLDRLGADQVAPPEADAAEGAVAPAAEFQGERASSEGPALVPPTSPASAHVVSRQKLWGDDDGAP